MKLIKIKINNRVEKILNFDDDTESNNNHYIIRYSGSHQDSKEIFRIADKYIDGSGERPLSMNVKFEEPNQVKVNIEEFVPAPRNSREDRDTRKEEKSLFELYEDDNEFICKGRKPKNLDLLEVMFTFGEVTHSIFLHYPSVGELYDAIIDFGSEASQACYIYDGEKQDINLTQSIRENAGLRANEDNEYVQYENDRLYKSIYYIKKELATVSDIKEWPDYSGDVLKFLVSKETEVADLSNYIQLPNSKLVPFRIADFAKTNIKVAGNNHPLWTIGRHRVERVLLNNIVFQVLAAIEHSAVTNDIGEAFVVLNVLMPNVYPIHVIANKLNELAKNIEELIHQDNFSHVKAVELRSVSESDASLLGYINSITNADKSISQGNYLIVDAGKGTLDFSMMHVNLDGGYVNKSRAGIVGAGNAVTYGVIVGLVHDYLGEMLAGFLDEKPDIQHRKMQEYIYGVVLRQGGQDVAAMGAFSSAVEQYKRFYNSLYGKQTYRKLEESEASLRMEELALTPFVQWIKKQTDDKKPLSKDGCDFVSSEIERIVDEAVGKMSDVLSCDHVNDDDNVVNTIVFTGRGCLMHELREMILNRLRMEKIIDEDCEVIVPKQEGMKEGCLNINQVLITNKYDESPSRQTCGVINPIVGTSPQKKSQHKKKVEEEKKPDWGYDDFIGGGGGVRRAGGGVSYVGQIEKDGIRISGISATSRVSIGGWQYDIDKRFKNKDCTIFFDGTCYWITAPDVEEQPLDAAVIATANYTPQLTFESLFPNVNITSPAQVKIPVRAIVKLDSEPLVITEDPEDDDKITVVMDDEISIEEVEPEKTKKGRRDIEEDDSEVEGTLVDKGLSMFRNLFRKKNKKSDDDED